MTEEQEKELKKMLLKVMDRIDINFLKRHKILMAIGKEFGLTEEETREEMLKIRKEGEIK